MDSHLNTYEAVSIDADRQDRVGSAKSGLTFAQNSDYGQLTSTRRSAEYLMSKPMQVNYDTLKSQHASNHILK